jgi:hypothetical protein
LAKFHHFLDKKFEKNLRFFVYNINSTKSLKVKFLIKNEKKPNDSKMETCMEFSLVSIIEINVNIFSEILPTFIKTNLKYNLKTHLHVILHFHGFDMKIYPLVTHLATLWCHLGIVCNF